MLIEQKSFCLDLIINRIYWLKPLNIPPKLTSNLIIFNGEGSIGILSVTCKKYSTKIKNSKIYQEFLK